MSTLPSPPSSQSKSSSLGSSVSYALAERLLSTSAQMKPASLPNGSGSSPSLCPSCYRSQKRRNAARFARAALWLLRRLVEGLGWVAVLGLITRL